MPYNPSLPVWVTGFQVPPNLKEEGKKPQHACSLKLMVSTKPLSFLHTGLRMYVHSHICRISWSPRLNQLNENKVLYVLNMGKTPFCSAVCRPAHTMGTASEETNWRKSDAHHKYQRSKEEGRDPSCTFFFFQ